MQIHQAVAFALSLPEAHEEPHFELRSFRVGRKIFATVTPDQKHLHVFVEAECVPELVAEDPRAFAELRWGAKAVGLRITLRSASATRVRTLIADAWRRRAPKRAIAEFDARARPRAGRNGGA